jgi:hypothetical protein
MHEPLSGAVLAHDRLFRPAGTLLESDSVEMAERSISTGLEKFVASTSHKLDSRFRLLCEGSVCLRK